MEEVDKLVMLVVSGLAFCLGSLWQCFISHS